MSVFHAHALHFVGIRGFAFLAGFLLAAVFLAFLLFVIEVVAAVFAHFESVEQIVNDIAKLALVFDQIFQPVEIAAGAVFDQWPPQINQFPGRRRWCHSGQTLAHHQGQRVFDRRIGTLGDFLELAAMEALVKHGRQILGDAIHAPRADRLDARLFHRFKYGARLLAGRLQPAVHGGIMAGKTQRD